MSQCTGVPNKLDDEYKLYRERMSNFKFTKLVTLQLIIYSFILFKVYYIVISNSECSIVYVFLCIYLQYMCSEKQSGLHQDPELSSDPSPWVAALVLQLDESVQHLCKPDWEKTKVCSQKQSDYSKTYTIINTCLLHHLSVSFLIICEYEWIQDNKCMLIF